MNYALIELCDFMFLGTAIILVAVNQIRMSKSNLRVWEMQSKLNDHYEKLIMILADERRPNVSKPIITKNPPSDFSGKPC